MRESPHSAFNTKEEAEKNLQSLKEEYNNSGINNVDVWIAEVKMGHSREDLGSIVLRTENIRQQFLKLFYELESSGANSKDLVLGIMSLAAMISKMYTMPTHLFFKLMSDFYIDLELVREERSEHD